jgi:hypothetical protein
MCRRPGNRRGRGEEAHDRAAGSAHPSRAVLPRHPAAAPLPGRVRRAVPVLHQRRGDPFPRCAPRAQPLPGRVGLPHPGRAPRVAAARLRLGAGEAERDSTARRAQALPDRSEPGERGRDRCRPAPDARHDGHRDGQDADDGQRDLPADEIRRRAPRAIPRRPAGAGRANRPGVRLLRGRAGPEVRQGLPGLLPALPAGRPGR